VKPFEDALLTDLRTPNSAILDDIRDSKDLSDATAGKLQNVVEQISKTFA
jgi:F-type H+-transporting ATPase subunit alpha